MAHIKTEEDIVYLRESGKRLAFVLHSVAQAAVPGVSTKKLNEIAETLIYAQGDTPAFKNYQPVGAKYPFPAALCVSVNDEVVHGIPGEYVLREGDIVGLDLGLSHNGRITDAAVTVPVGKISAKDKKLLDTTKQALYAGINAAHVDKSVHDIGRAVERQAAALGYGIVKILGGHGVGHKVHETPFVPNFDMGKGGVKLRPNMVIAIEPMLNEGTDDVVLAKDGYTFKTRDKKKSAHFEHTILISKTGPEILTEFSE